MKLARSGSSLFLTLALLATWPAHTADVKVQPAPGDGLVVTDSTGSEERLRVQEGGEIFLPGLAPQASADMVLCTDTATGQVGTCAPAPAGSTGPAGPAGLTWRGAWAPATAYLATDAVHHDGSAWVAVAPSQGVTPGTDPASWDLLAQKGADGAAGPPGGLTVIRACNEHLVICGINPCSVEMILNATCPVGYQRLSLISCSSPISPGLRVTAYTDPTLSDRLACIYNGTISPFTSELLAISITCAPNFPSCSL